MMDDQDLMYKMKTLLNDLTPNNFVKMKEQVLSFPIDTEDRLKCTVDLVFEKAIMSEQAFIKTYAQLCRDLSQLRAPMGSGQGMVHFRTLLINRCQKEFEKEKTDMKEEEEARESIAKLPVDQRQVALEELELKLIKNKRRVLGNILFIGELFKLQMLVEQIMHDCIFKLLCSKDEESLECMTQLMSTIGKILDHEKAKNRIDQYFTQIKNIISQKKTSARIRFMLQDVVDLRNRNWIPRRDTDNPKTIDQIRQDFKREDEQKKMEGFQAQMAGPPPRMSRNKRDQPQRVGPPQPEGWSTVTSTKATRGALDLNKFKITKQQSIDDDIQLGPGPRSFGGWSRGSSGGSTKAQTESPEPRQSNRFMMLSDEKRGRGPVADAKGRGLQPLQGNRSSSSRERDERSRARRSAIAEVQKISGSRRSQSREKERDTDIRRGKPESAPATALSKDQAKPAAAPAPALSEDVFEKKATATIEEFFNLRDTEEALMCVSELNSQSHMHILKLNFTLSTGSSSTTSRSGDANANIMSDEEWASWIKRELSCILASSLNVNDKVFDWIQKNLDISSPDKQRLFIRALVTVVVQSTIQREAESCRMKHDLLNIRTAILKRYINNNNNLELQALYAVQALNQHLENPPRLLGLIFNVLYDEDVIPEETFYAWQKSTDPNETLGKDVARRSVTSFFDWLREAEDEPAK